MDLHDLLDGVQDKASFFDFVRHLVLDRKHAIESEAESPSSKYGRDASGWENSTIESYLEAALSWAEHTEMGSTQGLSADPSWKEFAVFLYVGKIYE